MVKSVLSLVCLALVSSQVIGAPAPNEFPAKYLGTYESQPKNDQNFPEFVQPFNLPASVSLSKTTVFALRQEGEYFYVTLSFGPDVPPFELKFKLGETQTTTINGKNVEYVYTVENGDANPVLKGKFRDTESEQKFTADAAFSPSGINVTYAREGATARRSYTRIPCPSISGLYENVPEKQSPNFLEFANSVIPAPKGLSWDSNTGLWLGRWGGKIIVKYIITPSVFVKFPFRLNEKQTKEVGGRNVTYTYTLGEENYATRTTTLHGQFVSETGTLTLDAVITPEGITTTYKAGDKTATRYWKRTLNPLVYGTFESVPEASENWPAFATAVGKEDDSTQKTQVQIYKQGEQVYFRVLYTSGQSHVYPFALNKTFTTTAPGGSPVQYTYNEKPNFAGNDAIVAAKFEFNGKPFEAVWTFNTTGIRAVYTSGAVKARRYYQRTIPAYALGKFESTPDTPEFTQFAQSIGSPELAQKTTVELTQTPPHYSQRITVEGAPQPADFPFSLGQHFNTTLKGKNLSYSYMYFDYPVPVLHTYWTEANHGPTSFSVAAEFNPTGYTATYVYKGRLATRKYTRVGAPVELPAYPTA